MDFSDIMINKPEPMQALAKNVRQLILETDKGIKENIYGGDKVRMALYSKGGENNALYGIGVSDNHIKLYLHHTDKPGVNVAGLKLQGKGKHAKTVWLKDFENTTQQQLKNAFKSILAVSGY